MDAEDYYRCFVPGTETELSLIAFTCQNQLGSGRFAEQARGVTGSRNRKENLKNTP